MATLSAAIVKQQVASMHDVEEALARQVLYGGDLATNLLEAATVSEPRLTEVLAQCHGLAPAPAGPLPRPNPSTLRLVPADLAIRHGIYPIDERPGQLWVAVAEPIPTEVEGDLTFALGVSVVQCGALQVRIREAIARDYGAPLDRRLDRLLAKLEGRSEPPNVSDRPEARRPTAGRLDLPRPDTLPPRAYPPAPVLPGPRPPKLDAGLLRSTSSTALPRQTPIVPAPVVNVTAEAPTGGETVPTTLVSGKGAPSPAPARTSTAERSDGSAVVDPGTSESTSPPIRSDPPPPLTLPVPEAIPFLGTAEVRGPTLAPVGERRDTKPSLERPSSAGLEPSPLVALTPSLSPPSQRSRNRRGPYTAAMAERDLQEANTRDEVLRAFFDFCAQFFEYSALFAVQGDLAEGRDAHGPGATRLEVTQIGVPLDVSGLFASARAKGSWVLAPLANEGIDVDLARKLRRPIAAPVFVMPVALRERCVLLLWGDHGDDGVDLGAIGEVLSFAALTAAALEHIILERKRTARRSLAVRGALESLPQSVVRPSQRAVTPPASSRAEALTSALDARSAPPTGSLDRKPTEARAAVASPIAVAQNIHDALTPAAPPAVRASWTEPTVPVEDRTIPRHAPVRVGTSVPPAGTQPGSRPRHQTSPGVAPPSPGSATAPAVDRDETPELSVVTEELGDDWAVDGEGGGGVPMGVASRSDRAEPGPLVPRRNPAERDLPSVIVDVDSDAQLLVERLTQGDAAALGQLLPMGEPAIAALAASFPGPLTHEPGSNGRESLQPSRCGPVLDALGRIGSAAVPYLVVRSADANAKVRGWSLRMLGELRGRDAARAIARRVDDEDEHVRQAAIAGARLLQKEPEARDTVRECLLETASNPQSPMMGRHAAIEALGRIGDPLAVPKLIDLLADSRPDVCISVGWALMSLSLQDYGTDADAWRRWWTDNAQRHRIEWLIDALTHQNQEIRHAAGEELKLLTREYFGYYDDLPRQERVRAQERYREWWEARGRAIFT
ncbi:MAG: HEAT repeat domain-containing protein [Polyangiaceae bacterium]|nr:HEAT repeat domain-containing protein [Polyangiaceae bacterium]